MNNGIVIKEGVHFVGNPCKTCGNCIRYVKSNKCLMCVKEYSAKIYKENKTNVLASSRRWKRNNKKEKQEYDRIWYIHNREHSLDRSKIWQKNNPERKRATDHSYRARKSNAEGSFTAKEWINLCNLYGNKCLACGKETRLVADHIIPLSKGGSNWISNIQPLCLGCNSSKRDKTIDYRPDPTLINPAPATS